MSSPIGSPQEQPVKSQLPMAEPEKSWGGHRIHLLSHRIHTRFEKTASAMTDPENVKTVVGSAAVLGLTLATRGKGAKELAKKMGARRYASSKFIKEAEKHPGFKGSFEISRREQLSGLLRGQYTRAQLKTFKSLGRELRDTHGVTTAEGLKELFTKSSSHKITTALLLGAAGLQMAITDSTGKKKSIEKHTVLQTTGFQKALKEAAEKHAKKKDALIEQASKTIHQIKDPVVQQYLEKSLKQLVNSFHDIEDSVYSQISLDHEAYGPLDDFMADFTPQLSQIVIGFALGVTTGNIGFAKTIIDRLSSSGIASPESVKKIVAAALTLSVEEGSKLLLDRSLTSEEAHARMDDVLEDFGLEGTSTKDLTESEKAIGKSLGSLISSAVSKMVTIKGNGAVGDLMELLVNNLMQNALPIKKTLSEDQVEDVVKERLKPGLELESEFDALAAVQLEEVGKIQKLAEKAVQEQSESQKESSEVTDDVAKGVLFPQPTSTESSK